jgi:hypothetical protein
LVSGSTGIRSAPSAVGWSRFPIPDTDREAEYDPDIEADSRSTAGFRVACNPPEH